MDIGNTAQLAKVDDDTAVAHAATGDVVAATPNRQRQPTVPRERHRNRDVVARFRSHDHGRVAVDHSFPHPPGSRVPGILRTDDRAGETVQIRP